jgi:polyhydroxyalkanoate synthesis regulator phasin
MEQDQIDEAGFGTSGAESATAPIPPPTRDLGPTERFILAGIGAAATALDEADIWFDRFVARGQQVREDVRERTEDIRLQRAGARYRMSDALRTAMDAFLDTINIPNKGDVDTINVKLNVLTRKVDDLQTQTAEETAPSGTTPPPRASKDPAT